MFITYPFEDVQISSNPTITVDGTVTVKIHSFSNNPVDPQDRTDFECEINPEDVKIDCVFQWTTKNGKTTYTTLTDKFLTVEEIDKVVDLIEEYELDYIEQQAIDESIEEEDYE